MGRESGEKFGEEDQTEWDDRRIDQVHYSTRSRYSLHNYTTVKSIYWEIFEKIIPTKRLPEILLRLV